MTYALSLIAAAVALGTGYFFYYKKQSPSMASASESDTSTNSSNPNTARGFDSDSSISSSDERDPTRKANRCSKDGCRKKVATIAFPCRCGGIFCSKHRTAEEHSCTYDYKSAGREEIEKNNPKVEADKIKKVHLYFYSSNVNLAVKSTRSYDNFETKYSNFLPSRLDNKKMNFRDSNSEVSKMPEGILHYSLSETNLGSQIKIPDMEQISPMSIASMLIDSAIEADSKHESMSNFHIPMPFGMSPLTLKMTNDADGGIVASGNEESTLDAAEVRRSPQKNISIPDLDEKNRAAFEKARHACLGDDQEECDKALEAYHRIRFGFKRREVDKVEEALASDLPGYLQIGLAKWMLPSLEGSLEKITSQIPENDDSHLDVRRKSPKSSRKFSRTRRKDQHRSTLSSIPRNKPIMSVLPPR